MSRKSKGIFFLCCFVLLVVISRSIFKTDEKKENTVLSMEEELAKTLKEKFESSISISSVRYDRKENYLRFFININNKKDNKEHLYEEDLQTADEVVTFIEEYMSQYSDLYVVKSRKSVLFDGKRSFTNYGLNFHSDNDEVYFMRMESNYICSLSDLSIFTNIKKIYFNGLITIEDIEPIKGMKNLEYICLSWVEDKKDEEIISKELKEALPDCEVVWSDW